MGTDKGAGRGHFERRKSNVLAVFTAMVCCIDRIFCETILKIGNALAALVGLFLIACGLYLEFGPVDASSKLLEFLNLQNIEQVYNVVARFQIWVIVLGAVIFVLALFTFFCAGSNLAKVYYCIYSPVLEGPGSIQSPSTISNDTLQDISKDVGWNVSKCLYYETENVNYGCLRTLAMILYQVGTVLFIPGLVIASYILLLSLASSYLTCCAMCGKI